MKILLAVDGSLCSDAAITEVAARPWPKGSSVVILYVVHPRVPQIPDPLFSLYAAHEQSLEEEQESGQRRVEDAAERIRQNLTVDFVEVETIEGSPKKSILKEVRRIAADLVVLGSHGYGVIGRIVRGSVSQAVLSEAPCAVEVIRSPQGPVSSASRPCN